MGRRRLPEPTLRFDRRFRGVGRINRSSGTSSKKEFVRRDALLTELADAGQLEALRAFQAGDLVIEHLIEAKRSGELTSNWLLRDVKLDLNLWDALDELYGETKDRSTHHRYRSTSIKFAKVALETLGRRARVRDLRRIDWQRLRREWGGGAADWNHLRRMISRSLTHWMGDVYDPFRREVVKRIPREKEIPRIPDITIPMFWDILARTPRFAQPCYVTLVATGMRLGEYLACVASRGSGDDPSLRDATIAAVGCEHRGTGAAAGEARAGGTARNSAYARHAATRAAGRSSPRKTARPIARRARGAAKGGGRRWLYAC